MSKNNQKLSNRGEAIDFLYDNESKESEIITEDRDRLGSPSYRLLWLFRSPDIDMGFEEENNHWLVEDGTHITTSIHQTNRTEAYKQATGQGRPKTKEILEMEAAMIESQERMLGASFDEYMVGIIDIAWDPRYHPLDYDKIVQILDDIEAKYELKPIEIVQAYQMCEDRRKAELEMSVDG